MFDPELAAKLLEDLRTPLAKFDSARVDLVKALDTRSGFSARKLDTALGKARTQLQAIHDMIISYATSREVELEDEEEFETSVSVIEVH